MTGIFRDSKYPPWLMVFFLSLIIIRASSADEVIKKSGASIRGAIIEETQEYVIIDSGFSRFKISRDEIAEIKRTGNITPEEIEGDIAFQEGRYLDALKQYRLALKNGTNVDQIKEKIKKVETAIERLVNKEIGEIINKSRALVEQKQFEKAEALITSNMEKVQDEVLKQKLTEELAYIHLKRGEMYIDAINYTDAEEEFRKAIQIAPQYYLAHRRLAELLARNPSLRKETINEYLLTLQYGETALSERNKCEIYYKLGELYFDENNLSEAITYFRKALNSGELKESQTCKEKLVLSYLKLAKELSTTKPEEAILLLQSVLEIDKENTDALLMTAEIYRRLGKVDEAIQQFEEIIKINPRLPDVHYQLALCYIEKKMFDAAVEELRRELMITPQHYYALCELGELLIDMGQPQNALTYFERAKDVMPEKFRAYLGMGIAYWQIGKLKEAQENFQRVLAINPTHPEALFYMGSIYIDQKNYVGAENLFQSVIDQLRGKPSLDDRLRDLLVQAYIKYGNVELLLDRPRTAIEHYKFALEYKPDEAEAYYGLGQAFMKLGRFRAAEQYLIKATKLDPKNPNYYLGLGILYHNFLKELDKAVENYRKYIHLNGPDKLTVNKWIMECGGTPEKISELP